MIISTIFCAGTVSTAANEPEDTYVSYLSLAQATTIRVFCIHGHLD